MNWNQLGYLCRLFLPSSNLTSAQKAQLSSARHLRIYKCGQPDSSLATQLSAHIINSSTEHEQQKLALCYEQLPSTIDYRGFEYKNKVSYLAVVFAIFIAINVIYQLYVIPTFVAVFNDYQVQLNSSFSYVTQFWYVFVLLLGCLFITTWLSAIRLSQISNLLKADNSPSIFDFIIPQKIKRQHIALIAILEFPIKGLKENSDIPELDHLHSCQLHGLDISKEFAFLVKQKALELKQDANAHLNKFISVLTIVMVIVIALFLKDAYQPIFALGEIL
ncbi:MULTISPECIES: hypothetical protein [Pseudoalteromonas]|uniref:hypothetical protein n=1 Tax=Pseudoalteromonas TaxID=53246 RepID=UPI00030DF32B|nr:MULTISPECIES: hypothetical protein [Pseudoalteromonas]MCF6145653.1 hypothetical protein [Pseudoalteromonas mariniglutinosa NCIMB 1770]